MKQDVGTGIDRPPRTHGDASSLAGGSTHALARRACALVFSAIVTGVASLHAYWALGGSWGIYEGSGRNFAAGESLSLGWRLETWGLVVLLLAAALLVLVRVGIIRLGIPPASCRRRLLGGGDRHAGRGHRRLRRFEQLVTRGLRTRRVCALCPRGSGRRAVTRNTPAEGALPWRANLGGKKEGVMRVPVRVALTWAYVAGALIAAIGVFHDAKFHVPLSTTESLSPDNRAAVLWIFLCTGTAVVFAGLLCMLGAQGLVRGESLARRITLGSSLFLALLGVVGLVLNQWGASSLVALAVIALVPWWLTRRVAVASLFGAGERKSGGAA